MWTFTVRSMRAPLLLKWMLIRFGARFKVALSFEGKVDVVRFEYTSEDSASSAPLMLQKSTFTFDETKGHEATVGDLLYDEVSNSDWSFTDTLNMLPVIFGWHSPSC